MQLLFKICNSLQVRSHVSHLLGQLLLGLAIFAVKDLRFMVYLLELFKFNLIIFLNI